MFHRTCLAALFSLGIVPGVTPSVANASGPVAHWTANGDGSESAGGNNAMTVGPVSYEPTECGLGFLLGGSTGGGGHLFVPPPVAAALGGVDGFTVTATFREDAFGNNASIANLRLPANASGFTIGRNIVSGTTWTGMIDEVRFFDRALTSAEVAAITCCDGEADLDGNGVVDGADLGLLLGAWGPCENCAADFNCDRSVDGADLGALLAAWE